MTGVEGIAAVGPATAEPLLTRLGPALAPAAAQPPAAQASFGDILAGGMRQVEAKVADADALVRRFAVDDSVPLHQVTYALEEARLAVELAMQVRTRLVESYRELMNMQL